MRNKAFWEWVCRLHACDNPRGDFIRDTREAMERGLDPATELVHGVYEAQEEFHKLCQEYEREFGPLEK